MVKNFVLVDQLTHWSFLLSVDLLRIILKIPHLDVCVIQYVSLTIIIIVVEFLNFV